jgi:hypothetical protein
MPNNNLRFYFFNNIVVETGYGRKIEIAIIDIDTKFLLCINGMELSGLARGV